MSFSIPLFLLNLFIAALCGTKRQFCSQTNFFLFYSLPTSTILKSNRFLWTLKVDRAESQIPTLHIHLLTLSADALSHCHNRSVVFFDHYVFLFLLLISHQTDFTSNWKSAACFTVPVIQKCVVAVGSSSLDAVLCWWFAKKSIFSRKCTTIAATLLLQSLTKRRKHQGFKGKFKRTK